MFAILAIFALKNLDKHGPKRKIKETLLKYGDLYNTTMMAPSEVEKDIRTSLHSALYIDGNLGSTMVTEVDMTLEPTSKLVKLYWSYINGTVTVVRGNCGIIMTDSKGMTIKIITPPKSEMMVDSSLNVSAVLPPLIFNQQPEGINVEFQFNDLRGVKEADAFLYESSLTLPEYKVLNSGYKFTFKSKTVSGKEYGEDESKEFVLGYFEVKKDGLSGGEIAGIVIAIVVVVAGIIIGVVYALKCRSKKTQDNE